jgi:hypothetical protein
MIINFKSYEEMVAKPNASDGDVGVIASTGESYEYKESKQQWVSRNQKSRTKRLLTPGTGEDISWAPTVAPEEFTVLGNITSSMTSLVINLSAPPDSVYCYEYNFRFTTPSVLGITTFSILDHNSTAVNWQGYAPSLLGGKTYEVSVVDGLAVIGESV